MNLFLVRLMAVLASIRHPTIVDLRALLAHSYPTLPRGIPLVFGSFHSPSIERSQYIPFCQWRMPLKLSSFHCPSSSPTPIGSFALSNGTVDVTPSVSIEIRAPFFEISAAAIYTHALQNDVMNPAHSRQ